MTRSLALTLSELPSSGMTLSLLELLDQIIPGQWENQTDLHQIVASATGEQVPAVIQEIAALAEGIFADPTAHWNLALALYQGVDTVDQVAAGATVASKVSDLFGGLDFLKKITPKPTTTQALDAGLKLVAEMIAFCLMHGMPSADMQGVARFVVALSDYGRSDLMRIAAWVIVDGLLPLGPEFMQAIIHTFSELADSQLAGHSIFQTLGDRLPGEDVSQKKEFILKALRAASGWVGDFVKTHGLTHEVVKQKVSAIIAVSDDKLDYVAAAIDASTAYFSHTGAQTVARVCAQKAYAQAREAAWQAHVAALAAQG